MRIRLLALVTALTLLLAGCASDTRAAHAEATYRAWVEAKDRFLRGESTEESTATLLRLSSPAAADALRWALSGFAGAGVTQRGHVRVTAFREVDASDITAPDLAGGTVPAAFAAEVCVDHSDVSYVDENGDLVEGQPSKQPQSVMVVFLAGAESEELVVADSRSHDSDICGPGLR